MKNQEKTSSDIIPPRVVSDKNCPPDIIVIVSNDETYVLDFKIKDKEKEKDKYGNYG